MLQKEETTKEAKEVTVAKAFFQRSYAVDA